MSDYRVLVTDQVTTVLVGVDTPPYLSPPQTEQRARSLIGLPAAYGQGPWCRAVAGGQRIIELRPES